MYFNAEIIKTPIQNSDTKKTDSPQEFQTQQRVAMLEACCKISTWAGAGGGVVLDFYLKLCTKINFWYKMEGKKEKLEKSLKQFENTGDLSRRGLLEPKKESYTLKWK